LRIATPVGIQEECGRAHFSDEIEIAVFGFSAIERGFLKKDACFFHHSSARAHKRLCHLRIDNGNENSPA
jgi:hypothetical protein